MSTAVRFSAARRDPRLLFLAIAAGLACALALARTLPLAIDAIAPVIEPL